MGPAERTTTARTCLGRGHDFSPPYSAQRRQARGTCAGHPGKHRSMRRSEIDTMKAPNSSLPGNASSVRTKLMVWVAAAILISLTWGHIFLLVDESRARETLGAENDLSNLTRVSQEHAIRTLRSADQVIRFVQAGYLEKGNRLDLRELTEQGVIDVEIFNQVGVINEKGIYVLSNLPLVSQIDLSDREHFRVHVPADTGELFVSKPVLGRASGKWSVQLTRRITRANGEFAGVVVVSIDPGYFTRFYSELNLGPQGLAALYGLDGVARARKLGSKEEFGTSATGAVMFARMKRGELFGTYTSVSVVDGVNRVYFFRKIPGYPLAVSAGLSIQDVFANHRQGRDALIFQASLLSLLILLLAAGLNRHLRQIRLATDARQLAQQSALEKSEQLSAIFSLSPDGFVSFDPNHRVSYVNPAFARMTDQGQASLTGMEESELSSWLVQRCKPGARFVGIATLRDQATNQKNPERELIEMDHPGRQILEVILLASSAGSVSQILYFRDVTHEVEVDQMKSEFLSTAAHELRTPMAGVLGFAEVLLNLELSPAEQRESLTIIFEQSKFMANILNELLDLARIEERRGKDFRYSGLCLQELITQLVKAFALPPQRSAPRLVFPSSPTHVMADRGKLQQAILNVLSNAYKYSPGGGEIVLEVEQKDEPGREPRVCIHITDHGIGLTPEQLLRVGERFYRADISGKLPGTGLGMSIAKEIMALHQGQISLSSTLGQGTRVSLCLPLHAAPQRTPVADPR